MTTKEYIHANGCALDNSPDYMAWTCGLPWEKKRLLLGDNRQRLARALGKAQFHYVGEFRFYGWAVPFGKSTYIILTASTKGTCLEIAREPNDNWSLPDNPEYVEFGKWLLEKMEQVKERRNHGEDCN